MSLLDTASLIVTPNGYKEGKLYSVIPSDGSGDMSVTRATTATRVNSAGLVELVPYNLVEYSEQFDNAAWTKSNTTATANTILSPIGTLTADSVAETTATNSHELASSAVTFSASTKYTTTLYAKWDAACTRNIHIRFGNCASANIGASFDKNGNFVNYTGGSNGTLDSYSATDVGNGWWKFVITITTANVTSSGLGIYVYYMDGTTLFYTGNTSQIINFWGAQLVQGSTAKDYQKTETRLNIPRLDYSNGTCPSLLVEPQRTNSLLYSEQFNNGASWGANGIASYQYVSNPVTGLNNAMKITKVTGNTDPFFQQGVGAGNGAWTYSMWLWTDSGQPTTAAFYMFNASVTEFYAQSITLTNVPTRYTFTSNFTNTGGLIIVRTVLSGADANQYIYAYGGQAEFGSYATSYIPTTSASVTRNADVISKNGISSLIGQTEGTLFVDAYITGKDSSNGSILFATDKVSSGALIRIIYTSTNALRFDVFDGSSFQCLISAGAYNVGDRVKVAGGYKNNDFVMYVNGTQIGTDTSGSVPATDTANINTSIYGDTNGSFVNAAALWKTRLTNTQLAQLTTI